MSLDVTKTEADLMLHWACWRRELPKSYCHDEQARDHPTQRKRPRFPGPPNHFLSLADHWTTLRHLHLLLHSGRWYCYPNLPRHHHLLRRNSSPSWTRGAWDHYHPSPLGTECRWLPFSKWPRNAAQKNFETIG